MPWVVLAGLWLGAGFAGMPLWAQGGPEAAMASTAPQSVIRWTGTMAEAAGKTVELRFSLYENQAGGLALWSESQLVKVEADGRYTILLGETTAEGLPRALFQGGVARWLAARVVGEPGEPAMPRSLLAAAPYAFQALDAETLGGRPAADFVTQDELQSKVSATAILPVAAGTAVTGTGTAGFVPLWSGAATLGDSMLFQMGTRIGLGTTAPASTLDVNGTATLRGTVVLPPEHLATVTTGMSSQLLEFGASTWDTATSAPVTNSFGWQAATGPNNTSTPFAYLHLMYASGSGTPTWTGLTFNSNGTIHFAAGQTFPGAVASVTAASPLTATTSSAGAVTLGLNTSPLATTLETTLNKVYAQLDTSNVFTSFVEASQASGPSNAALLGLGTHGSVGAYGTSDIGFGVNGNSVAPGDGVSGVMGNTGGPYIFSGTYNSVNLRIAHEVAGVWGDTTGNPNTKETGSLWAAGVLGTADNSNAGAFFNNSTDGVFTLYAQNFGAGGAIQLQAGSAGDGMDSSANAGNGVVGLSESADGVQGQSNTSNGVRGFSGSGNGLVGISETGDGIYGTTNTTTYEKAGVLGVGTSNSVTFSHGIAAGVWGDNGEPSVTSLWNAGVIGTADAGQGGIFLNNSASWTTLFVYNYGSKGTGLFKTLMAGDDSGTCGVGGGGNLSCTGQVKALVSAGGGGRTVETYSVQSPENWIEDFGSGTVENGKGVVTIDAEFAGTVSESADYHVFLTPNGDSKGLYVTKKTATTFEVRESGGGTSSLGFDYRIVAKRRGFEAQRLTDVTDRVQAELAAARPAALPAGARPQPRRARPVGQHGQMRASSLMGNRRSGAGGAGSIFGPGVVTGPVQKK